MGTGSLRKMVLAAMLVLATLFGAHADDPVYITGAEYTIDGSRLTVTSGNGTLISQTPSSVIEICVTNGASLKIGIDDPFGSTPSMYLFGKERDVGGYDFATLDLNGHSITIKNLDNRWRNQGYVPHPGPGQVVNTSSTAANVNISSATVSSYFFGNFIEQPGKISVETTDTNFFVLPTVSPAPLSSLTMRDSAQLQILDRASKMMFVFEGSGAEGKGAIRLAEISPTSKGLPLSCTLSAYPAVSTVADFKDPNALLDASAQSVFGTTVGAPYRVVLSFSDFPAIDGYRITPYSAVATSAYTPNGWKVYEQRHDYIGYILVDERTGDNVPWYTKTSQSSTTNISLSADIRIGSLLGTNTALNLNATRGAPQFRLSGTIDEPLASISGSSAQTVKLEDGSMILPTELASFLGTFTASGSPSHPNRLALRAGVSAEHPLSISDSQNIDIVNGGTEDVSVLLDGTRSGHFFGRMMDGENGRLGLVKRGHGERVVETEGAAYTGATAIHGGTLTVARRRSSYTARYIRITPLATRGVNADYPWGMNEFTLLDDEGNAILWPTSADTKPVVSKPSTTANPSPNAANLHQLTDNRPDSRMLMNKWADGSTDTYPPVTIDAREPVTFSSYRWNSPHNHSIDEYRTSLKWKVEVSNDNVNWTLCDIGEHAWTDADDTAKAAGWAGANSVARGPFALKGSAEADGTAFYELPERYFADGSARDTGRPLKARYFRLRVYETQNPNGDANSYGWQMAEFSLWKNGTRLIWPITTAEPALGGSGMITSHNSKLTNLVNNVIWAEGEGGMGDEATGEGEPERTFITRMPSFVIIDAGQEIEFDAYSFTTTGQAASQNNRLPKAWRLQVSLDGLTYYNIDEVGCYVAPADVMTGSYKTVGPFSVADKFLLTGSTAANSIGDESPVAIDAGAALKLATDYEKFGPLSGTGTVELEWGAVGEINACAPATFSGSVTGRGTLAVCGDSVQTFEGATLAGAGTLELNGGAIAGTASFGGNDVTVAFNGGATRATLSGIGTLTVTGDVKYALPDVTGMDSCSVTLFTATSIPAASQSLLAAGEFVNAARSWLWNVTVTDTTVTLKGCKRGMVLLIE